MKRMTATQADFAGIMRPWTVKWGVPGLEDAISVRFDARLGRSLGRCRPERGEITLHNGLRSRPKRELVDVLRHEAAHIAAYHLFGGAAQPHGPEWAALVSAAGQNDRGRERRGAVATARLSAIAAAERRRSAAGRPKHAVVVHRCPVCQMERLAYRVVPGWRCAECVAAGLPGRLEITTRATQGS